LKGTEITGARDARGDGQRVREVQRRDRQRCNSAVAATVGVWRI